jgi:hypothetical protein
LINTSSKLTSISKTSILDSKFLKKLFYIIFKNRVTSCFSTLMAEKKAVKKISSKATAPKAKVTAPKAKVTAPKAKVTAPKAKVAKSKPKKSKEGQSDDMGIVIVDDDITIDQEKVNEERRAYLEESRSQDAYD